ncbi:MAG: hypothetical protein WAM14_01990 [Candidatus Nitrosopolaris sp.]
MQQHKLMDIRKMYRTLLHAQNNIVQSTDIATACVCDYLFKLSYPYGVISGKEDDFVVADTVHEILSLIALRIILEHWECNLRKDDVEVVVRTIERDSENIVQQAIQKTKDRVESEGRRNKPLDHNFEYDIYDRLHGILIGLASRIMKKYECPKRVVTEVTITNVSKFHEGTIDAILEYSGNRYGLVDWKTYDVNPANSSGKEKWQLLANLFLANYRYTKDEDEWASCLFGSIVFYEGAFIPRLPLSEKAILKIKKERQFAYDMMCGNNPKPERPDFCAVCDIGRTKSAEECYRYHQESYLAKTGQLPAGYDRIRRFTLATRYKICRERGETYRHKFVISQMIQQYGEEETLNLLEHAKIIHRNYRFEKIEVSVDHDSLVYLTKKDSTDKEFYLETRKIVRIIRKENNIPLLACVSKSGSIYNVKPDILIVDFRKYTTLQHAKEQLFHGDPNSYELIVIPDEINLTRRMLYPLHKLHRLAADIMVPTLILGNDANPRPNNAANDIVMG